MNVRQWLSAAVFFLLIAIPALGQADEIVDAGTVRNNMHSCPVGYAMTGLRIDQNRLLCSNGGPGGWEPLSLYPSTEFVTSILSSCPTHYVLTGVDIFNQLMACTMSLEPNNGVLNDWITTWDNSGPNETVRSGMHACLGLGVTYMIGIQGSSDNDFECGWWQVHDPF